MFDYAEADRVESDWLHPVQRDAGARRDSLASGERALMLAILEDAIRCLEQLGALRDEAEAWILSNADDWPCTFVNVCAALDLDPAALRVGLLALRARPAGRRTYRLKLRLKGRPTRPMPPPSS
jgi:hypothetical protein